MSGRRQYCARFHFSLICPLVWYNDRDVIACQAVSLTFQIGRPPTVSSSKNYIFRRKTNLRKLVSQGIVMFAGLLASPVIPHAIENPQVRDSSKDPRLTLLKRFFEASGSPAKEHVADFI